MTTDTTTDVRPITAQDIRALKHANGGTTFHLHQGEGYIRAHRRGENTASGFDESHQIPVRTSLADYNREDGYRSGDLGDYEAFHMDYGFGSDEWRTILHAHLRAGDTVWLQWTRSNNNELFRGIHWHQDELRLVIERKDKRYTYLIDTRVGPDNSARMVRKVR
jgi:hypothetical protein